MSSTAGNPFGTLYGGPLHQQPTSAGNQGANSAIPPPLGNCSKIEENLQCQVNLLLQSVSVTLPVT